MQEEDAIRAGKPSVRGLAPFEVQTCQGPKPPNRQAAKPPSRQAAKPNKPICESQRDIDTGTGQCAGAPLAAEYATPEKA